MYIISNGLYELELLNDADHLFELMSLCAFDCGLSIPGNERKDNFAETFFSIHYYCHFSSFPILIVRVCYEMNIMCESNTPFRQAQNYAYIFMEFTS